MKTVLKIGAFASVFVLIYMIDIRAIDAPPARMPVQFVFVGEAQAIFGIRRRARRRGVVMGYTAGEAAARSSQAAATQQQTTTTHQQAAPAAPAATGKPLPIGTVVAALPAGCTPTPVNNVQYYYCSGNFYRAVFQANQLVYVTATP